MAEELAQRGWTIDVITLDRGGEESKGAPQGVRVFPVAPPEWPARAQEWVEGLNRRVRGGGGQDPRPRGEAPPPPPIESLPDWDPGAPGRLRDLLRSFDTFLGDRGLTGWNRRAAKVGRRLAGQGRYDAVVASTPPHDTQLAALAVARSTGLPYVADFRDPWYTGLGVELTGMDSFRRSSWRRRERAAWQGADVIVHNNHRSLVDFPALGPAPTARRVSIPNGWDHAPEGHGVSRERFRVIFAGMVHPFMDIRGLLAATSRLLDERPGAAERLKLTFLGSLQEHRGVPLQAMAQAYGLGDVFEWLPRVPREEAVRIQEESAVRVAYDCLHPYAVPSKLYDYARSPGGLLLIGNRDGAMADAGAWIDVPAFAPDDSEGIAAWLRAAFDAWEAGERVDPERGDGQVFARRLQVDRMVRVLEQLVTGGSIEPGGSDPTGPVPQEYVEESLGAGHISRQMRREA